MEIRVITISRQIAAAAVETARILAGRLCMPLFEQEIIDHAAAAAGVSVEALGDTERVPPLITRIVEQLGRYPLVYEPEAGTSAPLPANLLLTSADYRRLIEDVIRRVADRQPAIIVGNGAGAVLGPRPDVLRVFLYAPVPVRVERLVCEEGSGREQARRQIEESDRARAEFFRHYYNLDWLQPRNYDLMVNTGRCSAEAAAQIIEAAMKVDE